MENQLNLSTINSATDNTTNINMDIISNNSTKSAKLEETKKPINKKSIENANYMLKTYNDIKKEVMELTKNTDLLDDNKQEIKPKKYYDNNYKNYKSNNYKSINYNNYNNYKKYKSNTNSANSANKFEKQIIESNNENLPNNKNSIINILNELKKRVFANQEEKLNVLKKTLFQYYIKFSYEIEKNGNSIKAKENPVILPLDSKNEVEKTENLDLDKKDLSEKQKPNKNILKSEFDKFTLHKPNTQKEAELPNDLKKVVDISTKEEPEKIDGKIIRCCISTIKNYNFYDYINFEANGIVFDFDTLNILTYPIENINICSNINKFIEKTNMIKSYTNQQKYKIFEMIDGTMINIYWYKTQWEISTRNGYSMRNVKWLSKTYGEVFDELLKDYKIDLSKLDKDYSYSFIFRHKDFHLHAQNEKNLLYLTKIVNIKLLNKYINDIDNISNTIEILKKANIALTKDNLNNFGLNEVKLQTEVNTDIYQLKKKFMKTFHDSSNKVLGWIVRGDYDTYGQLSTILLETSLMNIIRESLYNYTTAEKILLKDNEKINRLNYIILRSYLNPKINHMFVNIFPNLKSHYEYLDNIFNDTAKKIITIQNFEIDNCDKPVEQEYILKIKKMTKLFENRPEIKDLVYSNVNDREKTFKILIDFLKNKNLLLAIYNIIYM